MEIKNETCGNNLFALVITLPDTFNIQADHNLALAGYNTSGRVSLRGNNLILSALVCWGKKEKSNICHGGTPLYFQNKFTPTDSVHVSHGGHDGITHK